MNYSKETTKFNSMRSWAILFAVAIAFAIGALFVGTNKCYAEEKSYYTIDGHGVRITAKVNADGQSGYIEFADGLVRTNMHNGDRRLSDIGGTPLKDIIKFNDGGYVESIYFGYDTLIPVLHPCTFLGWDQALRCHAVAAGPKGLFSGRGYLHFEDQFGESYELSIWSSSLKDHEVSAYYDRFKEHTYINKITWNS